jgi:hypothetical protein
MGSFRILLLLFIFSYYSCITETSQNNITPINTEEAPLKPALLGKGIISTPLYERDLAISPNGDEIVYTLADNKQVKRCLVIIRKESGKWNSPQVMKISGKYHDIEPFFSLNGNRLYFASNRPIFNDSTRNDFNIWYSERKQGGWDKPVALDSTINSRGQEYYPSIGKSGALYFTASRNNGIGREDIFVAKSTNKGYEQPQPLPKTINTQGYEYNAFIAPNETYIIFGAYGRADSFGGGDLYISFKDEAGKWTPAQNMGPTINTKYLDYCPFVDINSGILYFSSDRITLHADSITSIKQLKQFAHSIENGYGNIYKVNFNKVLSSLKK